MPAPCSICTAPDRETVDAALALGQESLRSIGRRTGHDRSALSRHARNHLSPALVALHSERETAGAVVALDTVRQRVEQLTRRLSTFLDDAEAGGKAAQFLGAARELRASLELLGKLTGELEPDRARVDVTVDLSTNPEFTRYAGVIASVVSHCPECGPAVAGALRQVRELEAAS